MSIAVDQFLENTGGRNFTSDPSRPRTVGEENESHSNNSHRSSGSQRSSKSRHSTGNISTHSGSQPRKPAADKDPPPANIPDEQAPLGFHPEGSDEQTLPSANVAEETSTPTYLKWAESINYLLEDSEGVALFEKYLAQEDLDYLMKFYFVCSGIKKLKPDGIEKVAKALNRNYIRKRVMHISVESKKTIHDAVEARTFSNDMFDAAQAEVASYMQTELYPNFLKSDLYVEYVQQLTALAAVEQQQSSSGSSGSVSARPLSVLLPTVHEHKELELSESQLHTSSMSSGALTSLVAVPGASVVGTTTTGSTATGAAPLTSKNLLATSRQRAQEISRRIETPGSTLTSAGRMPHPYHSSNYVTVSTQDSELQSLSSEALTDDTRSLTDGSLDMRRPRGRHMGGIRRWAEKNKLATQSTQPPVIPRTERVASKDRNLAEENPEKFSKVLIDKLKQVLAEQEKERKMELSLKQSLKILQSSTDSEATSEGSRARAAKLSALMAVRGMAAPQEAEDSESILDAHISKVWDSSNKHTPTRSPGPGRFSPRPKSHHHHHKAKKVSTVPDAAGHAGHVSSGHAVHVTGTAMIPPANNQSRVEEWLEHTVKVESRRSRRSAQSSAAATGGTQGLSSTGAIAASGLVGPPCALSQQVLPGSSGVPPPGSIGSVYPSAGQVPLPFSAHGAGGPLIVLYYLEPDPIPYMETIQGPKVSLRQFKALINRKGTFRYYFKCNSSASLGLGGPVWEEVKNDSWILPVWDHKIVGKLDKID